MPSRTMRTAFLCWILCWAVIYDVCFLNAPCAVSHMPLNRHLVHLERMGSLSEEAARFYVAELGSALAFLHEKKIIHRRVLPHRLTVK